nr:MAG TPA: tail tape measure protein [Caudoviricetes sp.]
MLHFQHRNYSRICGNSWQEVRELAGTELAKAYVQIIPTTKGIKSEIGKELGEEVENAGDEAGKKGGENAGVSFAKKMLKIIAAAEIGKKVVEGIKASVEAGAALEQSIGGIETLFKESSNTMIQYANNAFRTCGLSANDYMETTTSFAASMLSSVGGDTAKAAELSNNALIAMSDNANKMGTNMQDIQNAYQGFAKQNYTMLDNLKLGYGGTKEEMQRLLSDANKLNKQQGIITDYSIDSFADITEAIQVVQDNLGITGTTALEAASTLSGSFGTMQAAWTNFIAKLSVGNRDQVNQAMMDLASSASTFLFQNLIPAIGRIITQLPSAIGTFITTAIPLLIENGKQIISNIIQGWQENKGRWKDTVNNFLDNAIEWIETSLPQILAEGIASVEEFIAGWGQGDGHMMATVGELIGKILTVIIKAVPQILAAGVLIVGKLAVGFIQNIPYFLTQIGTLLGQMISTIASNFPKLVSSGGSMLLKIIAGFINGITNIPSAVKKAVDSFKSNFRDVDWGELGTNIIKGIVNGITGGIGKLVTAAKNVAKNALDVAKEALGIHSPSRVFELEVGKMIDLGLAAGIERNLKPVQTSMKVLSMETVGSMDINTMFAGESTFYQNQSMELVDQNRSVIFNYERLADATVDAFERAGFTFRANNRELGRFVRGVNMA